MIMTIRSEEYILCKIKDVDAVTINGKYVVEHEASRSTHELNKREMFDGMRAFQQSELAHKADVLNFLKSILTGSIIVYGFPIVALLKSESRVDKDAVGAFALITLIVVCGISAAACYFTNKKIEHGHSRYGDFLSEYARESKWLGLMDSTVETADSHTPIKLIQLDVKAGDGYKETKRLIWVYGVLVGLVALGLSVIVWILA